MQGGQRSLPLQLRLLATASAAAAVFVLVLVLLLPFINTCFSSGGVHLSFSDPVATPDPPSMPGSAAAECAGLFMPPNATCPQFVMAQRTGSAGFGHQLMEVLFAMEVARRERLTYVYEPFYHSSRHNDSYAVTNAMFGIDGLLAALGAASWESVSIDTAMTRHRLGNNRQVTKLQSGCGFLVLLEGYRHCTGDCFTAPEHEGLFQRWAPCLQAGVRAHGNVFDSCFFHPDAPPPTMATSPSPATDISGSADARREPSGSSNKNSGRRAGSEGGADATTTTATTNSISSISPEAGGRAGAQRILTSSTIGSGAGGWGRRLREEANMRGAAPTLAHTALDHAQASPQPPQLPSSLLLPPRLQLPLARIVMHIRLGDYVAHRANDGFFAAVLASLRSITKGYHVALYLVGGGGRTASPERSMPLSFLHAINSTVARLWGGDGSGEQCQVLAPLLSFHDALRAMMQADVLVGSGSSLPQIAALLSDKPLFFNHEAKHGFHHGAELLGSHVDLAHSGQVLDSLRRVRIEFRRRMELPRHWDPCQARDKHGRQHSMQ